MMGKISILSYFILYLMIINAPTMWHSLLVLSLCINRVTVAESYCGRRWNRLDRGDGRKWMGLPDVSVASISMGWWCSSLKTRKDVTLVVIRKTATYKATFGYKRAWNVNFRFHNSSRRGAYWILPVWQLNNSIYWQFLLLWHFDNSYIMNWY